MDDAGELRERMAALERWSEGVQGIVESLLSSVDHLHDDLVAIREWCRIPRPECYPQADDARDVDAGVDRP